MLPAIVVNDWAKQKRKAKIKQTSRTSYHESTDKTWVNNIELLHLA